MFNTWTNKKTEFAKPYKYQSRMKEYLWIGGLAI